MIELIVLLTVFLLMEQTLFLYLIFEKNKKSPCQLSKKSFYCIRN